MNGLVHRQGLTIVGSTVYYDVTPPAGSNLNLWVDPDSSLNLQTTHLIYCFGGIYTLKQM